ncbi:hypothetical protein [Glutamicibacter sp. NPDC087344]|uniref:hypothetical protein n=1 Tax=Glutamicibacter sp. NPDC087344 TaxID=3363994 RepID=UPI003827A868
MPANLFLIQHFHDLRLHEGRNIGVAVQESDGTVHLRLGGQDATGGIDTRWLRKFNLTRSYYGQWRSFLERSARTRSWDEVLQFQAGKPSNIIARSVGVSLRETDDWARFTDSYFVEMVDSSTQGRESFNDRVRRFLESTELGIQERVTLTGRWDDDGEVQALEFPFGVEARQGLKVIAPIPLRHNQVYAFKASVDAVHRVNKQAMFVAITSFNDSEAETRHVEDMLRPLEAGSFPVNIEQPDAKETLLEALSS